MAQSYYSPISINSAQVPSTQTDFPVLVSQTDARFKTIANTGHVANSSGFDIRPYSDTALTSALSYELERYNATTGEVVMWVKVASLSSSTTPIYLGYGDTGLTTDGSSGTNTFSNSFTYVYHLKDGTTLSVADSLGANNGTNGGVTATSGQIDGCGGFASGSSQSIGLNAGFTNPALTMSAWVNGTTFPNDYNGVLTKGAAGTDNLAMFVKSNGKLYTFIATSGTPMSKDGTGSHTLSTSTWYLITVTYNSTAGLVVYVNAASDVTQAASGTASASSIAAAIGQQKSTGTRFFNGKIDEVRYCSVARSADWITTEYNNQVAPGTFESLGTEVAVTPPASSSNFFLLFD